MIIQKFRFKVEMWFKRTKIMPVCPDWDGYEVHTEYVYASDERLARQSVKNVVMRKMGPHKARLDWLKISEPVLIRDR